MIPPRWGHLSPWVWLASTSLAMAASARAQDPPPATVPARPISDSVDRVVARLEQKRKDPCAKAKEEGTPCFPVTTEIRGPEISVRDSLRDLGSDTRPATSGAPSAAEMAPFRPGPVGTVIPLVTFDPGCVGKSALKRLKGKNDVYYLYRVRDVHGQRAALYDHRLDPTRFQGDLEFLGEITGECEALAAYHREARRLAPGRP